MATVSLTDADVAYVRANYFTLAELCASRAESPEVVRDQIERGLLPAASYVLDDGTPMFPSDYFVLVDEAGGSASLRAHFEARHRACGGDPAELETDWTGYMEGVYGVCLRQVLPETMVRKTRLVDTLTELLAAPRPDDGEWRVELRRAVWDLDALERDFAPDYDRSGRFERPPTRDLLIATARQRYPELFGELLTAR
jgi:hypothetical protein